MFVKQIGMEKALELAAKGMEIKVLAPIGQEDGWENLAPDTLQHMLCLLYTSSGLRCCGERHFSGEQKSGQTAVYR